MSNFQKAIEEEARRQARLKVEEEKKRAHRNALVEKLTALLLTVPAEEVFFSSNGAKWRGKICRFGSLTYAELFKEIPRGSFYSNGYHHFTHREDGIRYWARAAEYSDEEIRALEHICS